MNFRIIYCLYVLVLSLSVWWGYIRSIGPYQTLILFDAGYREEEIAQFYTRQSIVYLAGGYGGWIVILIAGYYSGREFTLTKRSALLILAVLITIISAGNLVGYIIRQMEYPQYPIINISLPFELSTAWQNTTLLGFLGLAIGNLKALRSLKPQATT